MKTDSIRIPPHNIEAEQSILGGIFVNNHAMDQVMDILTPECFYRESHNIIFQGMIDLYKKNEIIDLITLPAYLMQKNLIEKTGGQEYMISLTEAVSTSAGIEYHAEIVRDKYVRRELLGNCSTICESCLQNWQSTEELLEVAENAIFNLAEKKIKTDFIHILECVNDRYKHLESISVSDSKITGVTTGFIDLDQYTAGFQPSDLIIIAGRPSMGKTAFALNIGYNAARRTKKGIAVFSLEMSKDKLTDRTLANFAKIDSNELRTGNLSDQDWTTLKNAAGEISDLNIFIDDSSTLSVLDMKAKCRRLFKKHDICMIIIDYLQLIQGRKNAESRQVQVSEISRGLKGLAKDLNVPVVALAQLNRKVEDRNDKRPNLADLKESGAIEQDADVVAFIYRDEVYNPITDENRNIAEIIISKNRDGATGFIRLTFQKKYSLFLNYIKMR